MDDIVKAAMAKWPQVPACYNWLGLDARGEWFMRDDPTQAAGPFPHPKGSQVLHEQLRAFIERNCASDERGCWYFQNGPQRVFIELEAAPRVWRLNAPVGDAVAPVVAPEVAPELLSAAGEPAQVVATWLDEHGRLFVDTNIGFGLVHTLDMGLAADAIDTGAWPEPLELAFADMPARFGYVLSPQALAAASR